MSRKTAQIYPFKTATKNTRENKMINTIRKCRRRRDDELPTTEIHTTIEIKDGSGGTHLIQFDNERAFRRFCKPLIAAIDNLDKKNDPKNSTDIPF